MKKTRLLTFVLLAGLLFGFSACEPKENNEYNYNAYQKAVNETVKKNKKNNKAILLVAFGSTWQQAFDAFDATVDAYKSAFSGYDVYLSFSSAICINRAAAGENAADGAEVRNYYAPPFWLTAFAQKGERNHHGQHAEHRARHVLGKIVLPRAEVNADDKNRHAHAAQEHGKEKDAARMQAFKPPQPGIPVSDQCQNRRAEVLSDEVRHRGDDRKPDQVDGKGRRQREQDGRDRAEHAGMHQEIHALEKVQPEHGKRRQPGVFRFVAQQLLYAQLPVCLDEQQQGTAPHQHEAYTPDPAYALFPCC